MQALLLAVPLLLLLSKLSPFLSLVLNAMSRSMFL
jgi:hypothetical protein